VHCDGVLNIPNICQKNLKCCVDPDKFDFRNPPPELIIMNTSERPSMDMVDDEVEDAKTTTTTPRPTTTTTTTAPTTLATTSTTEKSEQEEEEYEDEDETPPKDAKLCEGKCMSPFLSTIFCDHVERDSWCRRGHICCMSSPGQNNEPQPPRPAPPPMQRHPPTPQPIQKCPAYCLPGSLYSVCAKVLPHECADGFFCCVSPPPPPPTLPPQMNPQMNSQMNPQYSQNRPMMPMQHNNRPWQQGPMGPPPHQYIPMPPPRTNPPPTTTTTTEAYYEEEETSIEIKEEKLLPCPGSCISSIFYFTCFRNAEMTDLFSCSKPNTKCCA
ncbi:unnamed protein product, partial [Allacma fusca]